MFPGARELRSAPGGGVFGASHGMLDLYIRKDAFKRVEELSLKFIGGVVHRTDVRFRSQSSSENLTEFSAHVSKQLALPAEFWEAPSGGDGQAVAGDELQGLFRSRGGR